MGKPIDIEKLVAVIRTWCGLDDAAASDPQPPGKVEGAEAILKRFGGNLNLLRSMLVLLPDELNKQLTQLEAHRQARDLPAMLKDLHTLKGTSGTMGAMELSARFAELERRFAQTPDSAYGDDDWLSELKQSLQESHARLQAMFAIPTEPASPAPPTTTGLWTQEVEALKVQLDTGNLAALETVQALAAHAPQHLDSLFDALRQAVTSLDFERAKRLLQDLQHSAIGD